ncbi:MAG: HAD-IIA family hydrolase [Eubacteriales bacterium]
MNNVLSNKKLYIFDMDGTIYLGGRVFPFAVDFIKKLRSSGRRVLFFTNNASHDPIFYLDKLTKLGFEPSPMEIMTSGDVTIEFLRRHREGKSVYLVGTPQLEAQFDRAGINRVRDAADSAHTPDADIVITSFDTTLTYQKLDTACRMIRGGAEYLSTHPDFNCPVEGGFIPDSGAIAAFVTASTGVAPTYFGKPYHETLDMLREASSVSAADMCVFGDRLYTDIALGRRGGVTAVLVLTGETTEADVRAASESDRPDFIYPSLAEADADIFGK